jgi:hypothetical protein
MFSGVIGIAQVSGTQMTVDPNGWEAAAHDVINRVMKRLYNAGARRFRTLRMVRTGDSEKFLVIGWAK